MNVNSETSSEAADAVVMDPVSLTLSVVGDCTLGTDETFDYDTSLNAYYENYGSAYFLQNVKSIFSQDDLTIANFEGTLTESDAREDKTFAFKGPASFTSILTDGSVEAVNTANNHSHDYGDQSYEDTMTALDAAGIVHFGYDETAVMDVKGIKVGMVGIYELKDHLEREQQLKDNIAKVKADGAQLIVVIFHWGNETETVPTVIRLLWDVWQSMKVQIWYVDIILMFCRESRPTKAKISSTVWEISVSAETVLQVIWTL